MRASKYEHGQQTKHMEHADTLSLSASLSLCLSLTHSLTHSHIRARAGTHARARTQTCVLTREVMGGCRAAGSSPRRLGPHQVHTNEADVEVEEVDSELGSGSVRSVTGGRGGVDSDGVHDSDPYEDDFERSSHSESGGGRGKEEGESVDSADGTTSDGTTCANVAKSHVATWPRRGGMAENVTPGCGRMAENDAEGEREREREREDTDRRRREKHGDACSMRQHGITVPLASPNVPASSRAR